MIDTEITGEWSYPIPIVIDSSNVKHFLIGWNSRECVVDILLHDSEVVRLIWLAEKQGGYRVY